MRGTAFDSNVGIWSGSWLILWLAASGDCTSRLMRNGWLRRGFRRRWTRRRVSLAWCDVPANAQLPV